MFLYRILDFGIAFIPPAYRHISFFGFKTGFLMFLLTLAATVISICVSGWIIKTVIGRAAGAWLQSKISSVPIIGVIYKGFKQFVELFFSDPTHSFSRVVLVEFPLRGVWVYGFLTGDTPPKLASGTAEKSYNIFVPGAPNITSGFLIFVPSEDIRILDISVEQAIKTVVSGGILEK
jgi:uncharacterized membrane protein